MGVLPIEREVGGPSPAAAWVTAAGRGVGGPSPAAAWVTAARRGGTKSRCGLGHCGWERGGGSKTESREALYS